MITLTGPENGEYHLSATMELPLARPEVFEFFSRAENLGRITPPEMRFHMLTQGPIIMGTGALIDYTIRLHGLPLRWRTEITRWSPPEEFVDTQLRGPYARWVHTHRFRAEGDRTILEDRVDYRLPLGALGRLAQPLVARQLKRIFAHRRSAVEGILLGPKSPQPQQRRTS